MKLKLKQKDQNFYNTFNYSYNKTLFSRVFFVVVAIICLKYHKHNKMPHKSIIQNDVENTYIFSVNKQTSKTEIKRRHKR